LFLRWIHKIWKYFWTFILSLLLIAFIVCGGLLGIFQMQVTKGYMADWIQDDFQQKYEAELQISELDGLIPFNFQFRNVRIIDHTESDTLRADTLVSVDRVNASLDVWSLFQNKISITGFSVTSPRVRFLSDGTGGYTLGRSLSRKSTEDQQPISQEAGWSPNIEIIAPRVEVVNGEVWIEQLYGDYRKLQLPDPLRIIEINTTMFLEVSESQLFWDIEQLMANVPGTKAGTISINGQVYNDERFLEFNGFNFFAGNSEVRLNGEIDGVNLYQPDLLGQLRRAAYNIDISSNRLDVAEFSDLMEGIPSIPKPLQFSFQTEGKIDSLWVDEFSLGIGESYFSLDGFFENLSNPDALFYELQMNEVALQKEDIEILTGTLEERQFDLLNQLRFDGKASGSSDSLNVDLDIESPSGRIALVGGTRIKPPYVYNGSLSGQRVNIGGIFDSRVDTTSLNFDASVSGSGILLDETVLEFTARFYESSVNNIAIDNLELQSSLVSGFLEQEYTYRQGDEEVEGSGWLDLTRQEPRMALKGYARNINLARYASGERIPVSSLNFDYNVELQGNTADLLQGRANLDVKRSVINQDTVRSHQIYMDLDSPELENRSLRLTSSLFDLSMNGNIVPTNIGKQYQYWRDYLVNSYRREILLDSTLVDERTVSAGEIEPMNLEGEFKAKDLSLVRNYFPDFPQVATNTTFNFNINADSLRMLLTGNLTADSLIYNRQKLDRSTAQVTASFRSNQSIKEFANVDFRTDISSAGTGMVDFDSLSIDLALRNDSLTVSQNIGTIGENARMNMMLESVISDSTLTLDITEFFLGNNLYAWQNDGTPQLIYNRQKDLAFDRFRFKNQNEFIELKGVLSADRQDSVEYTIREVNLSRISELINGKVKFGGRVNGELVTQSLTNSPSVHGELNVNRLTLQNRLVGDASFQSRYNQNEQRFDTQLRIFTNPAKYETYLESNDDVGQDILISGYFVPPDPENPQETVYDFDLDFNEIDMWVVSLFADKVFDSMEGMATGEGYLRGSLEDYDFGSDFQVSNVYAKPEFLLTNYFLNGHVQFNRDEGVVIDSVDVTDTKGGTGTLWGTIDLNDFNPLNFFDLNMSLNDLHFLNNDFGPDVPFFGSVSGTGTVRLTGSNTEMLLQSSSPIRVSDNSVLSIPLLEETELSETNRFIQFVDEFTLDSQERLRLGSEQAGQTTANENALEQAIGELTFNERFNIDLQFDAPDPIDVRLIFDPVTGEILTAEGTGQLRITLQDEEVRMFGRYNISGGDYQFVSGEIISRRLALESGGTIVWEGDPDNARLNISAIYNARPNINVLSATASASDASTEAANRQRVPIDLIIEITGTVSSVENNYYFRTSNTIDLSSNSTLSFALNEINRDEQQKFLQATSILLTGEFIPSQSYDQATSSLSQNITRGSTVINPLLSNQVISPLLSNQINSLLNSDVSRFDIDFNLNAYNEIDLGIALRLYNDRLIFRREGQLTGGPEESSFGERIGDLNATYRINRGLSVTAFHRQDQSLGNVTSSTRAGDVTPSVDGIGLEAQLQFNTWRELQGKISNTFNKILGIKREEDNELVAEESNTEDSDNKKEEN